MIRDQYTRRPDGRAGEPREPVGNPAMRWTWWAIIAWCIAFVAWAIWAFS